jgi:hypothetical protein
LGEFAVPTLNRRRITLTICAALLLAAVPVAVILLTDEPELEFDENLWHAVTPAVHANLPTNPKVVWAVSPGERWFCAEKAIETRRDGSDVRVGLIVTCEAYSQRDNTLVRSSGHAAPMVVTLTSGPSGYQVRDVEVPADGAGHDVSVRRMFSSAGYEKIQDSGHRVGPDPAPEARVAFGLPADAPVYPR